MARENQARRRKLGYLVSQLMARQLVAWRQMAKAQAKAMWRLAARLKMAAK
jgi:hypothetical protein